MSFRSFGEASIPRDWMARRAMFPVACLSKEDRGTWIYIDPICQLKGLKPRVSGVFLHGDGTYFWTGLYMGLSFSCIGAWPSGVPGMVFVRTALPRVNPSALRRGNSSLAFSGPQNATGTQLRQASKEKLHHWQTSRSSFGKQKSTQLWATHYPWEHEVSFRFGVEQKIWQQKQEKRNRWN